MQESYTTDEFAACYGMRGYGRKKDALKWLRGNGMETAAEADFEKCYHELEARRVQPHGSRCIAMRVDGVNPSAPQYQPNSNGKSYNAQMMQAQREIDAVDRWAKKRKEKELEE